MLNSERTVVYDKYYILLYILGFGGEWNRLISLHVRNLYVYIFQIYEHFYHLCSGTLWKSILLESDDFIRLVLSSLEFPQDNFLEIPPSLSIQDFERNPVIINLNYIFTKTQIKNLRAYRHKFDEQIEDLSTISNQAKSLIEELRNLSKSINDKLSQSKEDDELQFRLDISDSEKYSDTDSWNCSADENTNYDIVDSVSRVDGNLVINSERLHK